MSIRAYFVVHHISSFNVRGMCTVHTKLLLPFLPVSCSSSTLTPPFILPDEARRSSFWGLVFRPLSCRVQYAKLDDLNTSLVHMHRSSSLSSSSVLVFVGARTFELQNSSCCRRRMHSTPNFYYQTKAGRFAAIGCVRCPAADKGRSPSDTADPPSRCDC